MTCTVDARNRARSVAEHVARTPGVRSVDVLEPTDARADEWTVEVLAHRGRDGIPPGALVTLGGHGFALKWAGTQGDHPQAVAVLDS